MEMRNPSLSFRALRIDFVCNGILSPLFKCLQDDASHVVRCFDLAMRRREKCNKFGFSRYDPPRAADFSCGTDLVKRDFYHSQSKFAVCGADDIAVINYETYMTDAVMLVRPFAVDKWTCHKE